MDVKKLIAEALAGSKSWSVAPTHGGLAFDCEMAANDIKAAFTANGLTVVSNEVVEALREIDMPSTNHGGWFEQDPFGEYVRLGKIAGAALAKLDQPQ